MKLTYIIYVCLRIFTLHTGLEICLGKPLDDTLLQVIRNEVQRISDSVHDFKDKEDKDVKSICSTLALFKSEFDRAVQVLGQQQSSLQTTCEELKNNQDMLKEEMSTKDKEQKELLKESELHWKIRQEQVESLCKTLEVKRAVMQRDLDVLRTKMDGLTFSDDSKEVVFDAPEQIQWFTGREKEVEMLERCLSFESVSGLNMVAICGLGGCGKTTLGAHFAWKHKSEYEGGVFWISMEDDRKFENSMNDLALRLGMLADSFDLTLSKVLMWISKRKRPWLLVLDDVDQLNLSEQMHKVLSGRWKRQASGHVLLTTRREPKEVCQSINLEPSCCVHVSAFSEDEAKRFLVARSDVSDATVEEAALDGLVRELGCLPLALEQAGAHIKALQCPVNNYLEEYKIQRLNLLGEHTAKLLWEYESKNRLAVHTTWLLNFEYVRKSPHGEVASSFVQAAAFLAPNEIQEELINSQLLSADDPSRHRFNRPLMKTQIVEILTKFSLFQRKSSRSLGLHRLVQEVIRNRMTIQETSSTLLTAVRILHQSFRDCPSPDQILADVTTSVTEQPSVSLANPSLFYLWSKLASHACEIQQHLKSLLDQEDIERDVKTVVLTRESSRVVYENAVQLSIHGHQEDAKDAERFAFQILDSCQSNSGAITLDELRELFPHTLPLPQLLQKIILYSSRPQLENQNFETDEDHQSAVINDIRLRGNALFKDGRFKEAVETYTEALEVNKGTKHPDPRLLNNRATAHLKLGNFDKCLHDSQEYINIMPNCWKGYVRKALALNGRGRRLPSLCSAAIAYYYDAKCCRQYKAFQDVFKDVDGNWAVVDSSETLKIALKQNGNPFTRKKILLLQDGQYEIGLAQPVILDTNLIAISNVHGASVTSYSLYLNNNCYFQDINFETEDGVLVLPPARTEFVRCNFQCSSVKKPAVQVGGTATLFESKISNCKGGGIIVFGSNSSASLIKCRVSGNGSIPLYSSGVRVKDDGKLVVHRCFVHGNTEGIHIYGSPEGSLAKEAKVTDSEVYDNKFEGIVVAGGAHASTDVAIQNNKIYHNGGYGARVSCCANKILFQRNMVFENFWWGVWVQCNSGGYYEGNEICNNKMGGMRAGKQSPGKPACAIENNSIHDNCGPAFHEGLRHFEGYAFPVELQHLFLKQTLQKYAMFANAQTPQVEISLPSAKSAEFSSSNQCFRNDDKKNHGQRTASNTNCTHCFRSDVNLKCCKRCMAARYCGKECQKLHWGKHKYVCQAAGQRNSIEVSIPVNVCAPGYIEFQLSATNPGLEPTGPDYAPPPRRDGTRFIVKMQTGEGLVNSETLNSEGYISDEYNPEKAQITVYDRSRNVDFGIAGNPKLYHLIMECGIMASSMYLSKKLFCWAAFKDGKTLRIFTHEFPPVQKW